MNTRYGFRVWAVGMTSLMILGLALATGRVLADDVDQDEALELRQAGQILPLAHIMERAGPRFRHGRLIKAELEREDGRLVYEIEYLENGEVTEFHFDAATGEFLGEEDD